MAYIDLLGLSFIRENLWRLEHSGSDDWMVVSFEITFPQLLEMARDLGLDVPCDEPSLLAIYARRDAKLARYLACSVIIKLYVDYPYLL